MLDGLLPGVRLLSGGLTEPPDQSLQNKGIRMDIQPESNGNVTESLMDALTEPTVIRDVAPKPPEDDSDVIPLPVQISFEGPVVPFAEGDVPLKKIQGGKLVDEFVLPANIVNDLVQALKAPGHLIVCFHTPSEGQVELRWSKSGMPQEYLLDCIRLLVNETAKM